MTSLTYIDLRTALDQENNLSPLALKSGGPATTRRFAISSDMTRQSDRPPFEHDRDRILQCRHFRRLAGKTQIFIAPKSIERRNRLSHTMEVYQLATSIGRRFNLNIPVLEAMCLGHDLGHPPFGHAGERALHLMMLPFGGFHHASHSVRVIDKLAYDRTIIKSENTSGLNLTLAVREGIFKHGWYEGVDFTRYHFNLTKGRKDSDLCFLNSSKDGSLEAQALQIADSVAYLNHDLEDLLNYGFDKILNPTRLLGFFTAESKKQRISTTIQQRFVDLLTKDSHERVKILIRDLYEATKPSLRKTEPTDERIIAFSNDYKLIRDLFYRFFQKYVYVDSRIMQKNNLANEYIKNLFNFFFVFFQENPDRLPLHIADEEDEVLRSYFEKVYRNNHYKSSLKKLKIHRTHKNIFQNTRAALAACDIVSYLTDAEAIEAVEELQHPHSHRGMEIIESTLTAFPDEKRMGYIDHRMEQEIALLRRETGIKFRK